MAFDHTSVLRAFRVTCGHLYFSFQRVHLDARLLSVCLPFAPNFGGCTRRLSQLVALLPQCMGRRIPSCSLLTPRGARPVFTVRGSKAQRPELHMRWVLLTLSNQVQTGSCWYRALPLSLSLGPPYAPAWHGALGLLSRRGPRRLLTPERHLQVWLVASPWVTLLCSMFPLVPAFMRPQ